MKGGREVKEGRRIGLYDIYIYMKYIMIYMIYIINTGYIIYNTIYII